MEKGEWTKVFVCRLHVGAAHLLKAPLRSQLFHMVDKDDDGLFGKEDFLETFGSYHQNGRVTPVGKSSQLKLSSADVFRRADKNGDGFLDFEDFRTALLLTRPQSTPAEIKVFWQHVDVDKDSRVDIEQFCKRMASTPLELNWEEAVVEDILRIIDEKRGSLLRVFRDLDDGTDQVLSKAEFRSAMMRLGLGLSAKKYDLLFDRVDLNKDGAINTGQFIAWVSGAQIKGPSEKLDCIRTTMYKHLGSPENTFLWFLKKHKLPDGKRALNSTEFEQLLLRDLPGLFNRPIRLGAPDVPQVQTHFCATLIIVRSVGAWLTNSLPQIYLKAGGRKNVLTMEKFINFFSDQATGAGG